jgi:hypothetical protein
MKHHVLKLCVLLSLTACFGPKEDEGGMPPSDPNPYWVWEGGQSNAPACPHEQPPAWTALRNAILKPLCGECTCELTRCELAHTVTAFAGAGCAGMPSGIIDVSNGWDGTCAQGERMNIFLENKLETAIALNMLSEFAMVDVAIYTIL